VLKNVIEDTEYFFHKTAVTQTNYVLFQDSAIWDSAKWDDTIKTALA